MVCTTGISYKTNTHGSALSHALGDSGSIKSAMTCVNEFSPAPYLTLRKDALCVEYGSDGESLLAPPDLNCEKLVSPVGSIEEALECGVIGLLGLVLSFVIQEDTSFDVNFGLTAQSGITFLSRLKFPLSKPINEFALSHTASRP